MSDNQPIANTDREIWRGPDEGNGSYYADSIHVTQQGGIGIDVGGLVFVKPVREWHKLAAQDWPPRVEGSSTPAPAASAFPLSAIAIEAKFLLDRLLELDDALDADYVREFEGHVRPPMSRLARLFAEPLGLPHLAASTVEPVARACPHDMGFDTELGPLGCRLVGQELECVCEHMHFTALSRPAHGEKSLSDYTLGELQSEVHWRAQKVLGDPRVGVTIPRNDRGSPAA